MIDGEEAKMQHKILIVDDEEVVRKLLHHKLSKAGYKCEEANSAVQALHTLERNQIELAILDIRMPGKSGIELLGEIRAKYPDIAVIMATAVTDTSAAIECMKQGAQDYLCKPFNLDEVLISVSRALENKRLELEIRQYQECLEEKVEEQTAETRKIFLSSIESLVFALEAKDEYTAGHSRRVAKIAVAIGKELQLQPKELEDLHWSALLHDIGKIAIEQNIQNKPGKLTHEEYQHIKTHTQVGAGIVRPVVNPAVIEIIEHHHDRYDGKGLNQNTAGEKIPLGARILLLADAFDAMTSERPYRSAMQIEEALEEIKACSDTQFDPFVVTAFLRLHDIELVMTEDLSTVAVNSEQFKAKTGSDRSDKG